MSGGKIWKYQNLSECEKEIQWFINQNMPQGWLTELMRWHNHPVSPSRVILPPPHPHVLLCSPILTSQEVGTAESTVFNIKCQQNLSVLPVEIFSPDGTGGEGNTLLAWVTSPFSAPTGWELQIETPRCCISEIVLFNRLIFKSIHPTQCLKS